MRCPDEGTWQAFVDNEVEQREQLAAHLAICASCTAIVDNLRQLADWSDAKLRQAAGVNNAPVIDSENAWQSLRLNLSDYKERSKMSKRKKWFIAAAAATVCFVSLSFPPVQAAVNDILSVFRIDKVEMVKLTTVDLEEVGNWLTTHQNGVREIKDFGKVWVENQGDTFTLKPNEAIKAGYKLPIVPRGYKIQQVNVSPSYTLKFNLNTDKANSLFKQFKIKARFDEQLNNKTFAITLPQGIETEISKKNNEVRYTVFDAPQVAVPAGVDMKKLRATVLSLPFIPSNVRNQLASIDDWQQTLPIPYVVRNKNIKTKQVKVHGVDAIASTTINIENGQDGKFSFVLWQRDGKFHYMSGYGNQDLVALANQIK